MFIKQYDKSNIEVKKMDIITKAVKHYGYHQGIKVYVSGEKYPKKRGHFYATSNVSKAVSSALRERKTGKEQYE